MPNSQPSPDAILEAARDLIEIRARLEILSESLITTIHALHIRRTTRFTSAQIARLPKHIRDALNDPLTRLHQTLSLLETYLNEESSTAPGTRPKPH